MTELPKGWAAVTLADVARWSSGGTPKAGTPAFYEGDIPWAVIGDLNDGPVSTTASTITQAGLDNSSAKVVDAGTVLVAMYGSIGKMGLAQVPMATNQAIACAVPGEAVSREWLFWWLRSQRDLLLAAGKGGTQSNISQTVLKAWPIPVAPTAEQERIVAAIEEAFTKLDTGEAGLRTVRQLLKRMRDAILAAAVTGRLVPQDPTDTPATKLLAELGIEPIVQHDLPDGWAWAALGEGVGNTSITDGPFGSNLKSEHYTETGPRVVRLQNIGDRVFRDEVAHISQEHFEQLRKYEVVAGDVLIASLGEVLPRACIAPPWLGPAIVKADCIRLRPGGVFSGSFLEIALNSPPIRTAVSASIKGVGRPRLNLGDLRALVLPVPPAHEQARIVSEVDRQLSFIEACERVVRAGKERSVALRRSVLKAAFEGRLVPQDPTDKPASELLERIRAERAAAPKAKTRRAKVKS